MKKIFILLLCFTFAGCSISTDFKELATNGIDYTSVYISERGFGNDRFDIYDFTLTDTDKADLASFKDKDEDYDKKSYFFKHFLELEKKDITAYDTVINDVDKLEKCDDFKYMYITNGYNEKMYIYSLKENKGYCFILEI